MIRIQHQDFDLNALYTDLKQHNLHAGAIVTFTGLVRDFNQGNDVTGLFLEHYPGMTERTLEAIIEQAKERFFVDRVDVIHRVGQLSLGDQIVYVGVSSQHREEAFDCAQYVMDYLKKQAPFWKKETTTHADVWLTPADKDQTAYLNWE
ncbi:molybdopterin synthase catalytic subunit MoaE [Pseudoalteromonas sp. SSM20]|uniref:molybdopterin synthase catalytic subunit MoaE n=1 Tax=Pseudoalteromonas sp. SSM20 TaxID=3139394 RepID=UPI003BADA21D